MAVRGLGRDETCIVHHDRPAAARCARCHKPICSECIVSTSDGKFCSRECAGKAADFRAAKKSMGAAGGRKIAKLIKLVIWIVVIVAALGAANKLIFKHRMPVVGPLLNRLPVLGGRPDASQ